MAGVPRGRLRAHPGGGDVDCPDLHGSESKVLKDPRGNCGDPGRAGLQLMVHDDGADGHGVAVHMAPAGEIGGDGGERQRVRAAAARDQDSFRVAGRGQGVLQHFPRGPDHRREAAGPASSAGNRRGTGGVAGGHGS